MKVLSNSLALSKLFIEQWAMCIVFRWYQGCMVSWNLSVMGYAPFETKDHCTATQLFSIYKTQAFH